MKILVISSNLIGDNILSSGVLQHFLKDYSNPEFTIITGPTSYQLYDHFPNLDKRIIIQKKKYNLHWFEILNYCLFKKWDIIVDFRSSLISYFFLRSKKFVFVKNKTKHHIQQLNELFKFDCSKLKIYNNDEELQKVKNTLNDKSKYVVICPGGNWKPKIWNVENFNQIIKKIISIYDDTYFIIVGSSKEKEVYYKKVINGIKNDKIINLMGESLTVTSCYMKKSNLFIGNDSGLMHLSVASNLSTIGLFGPTNDKIYGHKSNNCFILRTRENYEYLKNTIKDVNKSYMNSIKVEDVMHLIKTNRLLK